jgi:hypothetical protein
LVYILLALPEKAPQAAKPKGRAGSRKAPTKVCSFPIFHSSLVKDLSRTHVVITCSFQKEKATLVLTDDDDDDDDDDMLDLKERLAAYNLDSSPEQSAGKFYMLIFVLFRIITLFLHHTSTSVLKCKK